MKAKCKTESAKCSCSPYCAGLLQMWTEADGRWRISTTSVVAVVLSAKDQQRLAATLAQTKPIKRAKPTGGEP